MPGLRLRKDAPMRARAVEVLRANGKDKLADDLAAVKTMQEALRILNEASREK